MSFEPDNKEHESELQQNNSEIIKLLKAILAALEIISNTENLIDNVED